MFGRRIEIRFKRKNRGRPRKVLKQRAGKQTLGAILLASGVLLVLINPLSKAYRSFISSSPQASPNPTVEVEILDSSDNPIAIENALLAGKRVVSEEPTRILIKDQDIDLEIKPANVVDGQWEVFETVASYGIGSGIPGKSGNTVIFAHARKGLFLPLKTITKDSEVLVFTKDKWFSYKVVDIKEVLPTEVSVIAPTEDETLTLYTCSGFADSKRLIVVAKRT